MVRHSINVVNMAQNMEPEPYKKITNLLKQRKTQIVVPPKLDVKPKRLGLICKEINNLLASSPTTSVPILGSYECRMDQVLPRKVYNKWALKAFTLSSLIRKASKSVAAWTWKNKIPLTSINVLPETWGLILRSHQKHFHLKRTRLNSSKRGGVQCVVTRRTMEEEENYFLPIVTSADKELINLIIRHNHTDEQQMALRRLPDPCLALLPWQDPSEDA